MIDQLISKCVSKGESLVERKEEREGSKKRATKKNKGRDKQDTLETLIVVGEILSVDDTKNSQPSSKKVVQCTQ